MSLLLIFTGDLGPGGDLDVLLFEDDAGIQLEDGSGDLVLE